MSEDSEPPVTLDSATRLRLTVTQVAAILAIIVAAVGAVLAVQAQLTTITDRLSGTPDNPGLSQRIKFIENRVESLSERVSTVERVNRASADAIAEIRGRLDSDQHVNMQLLELLTTIRNNQLGVPVRLPLTVESSPP